MARTQQRNVKRQGASSQQLVAQYAIRPWYQLPDWAKQWIVEHVGWVVVGAAVILTPSVLLATVIGFRALPLEFIGVPATANDAGLAVVFLLLKFIFIALSIRPLFKRQIKGWHYLIAGAAVHFAHTLFLQHAFFGGFLLISAIILYFQVRRWY